MSSLIIGPKPPGMNSYKAHETPIGWVYDIDDLVKLPIPEKIDGSVGMNEYSIWWTEINTIIQKTIKRRDVIKQRYMCVDNYNTGMGEDKLDCWSCGRTNGVIIEGMCRICAWKSS